MDTSSKQTDRHGPSPTIIFLIVLLLVREFILFPALAICLVVLTVKGLGLGERLSPVGWCIAAPALYGLWMLIYLGICALHIQALFWGYRKPRRAALVAGRRETAAHVRLAVSYARSYLIKNLPFIQGLNLVAWLRNLFLLAYAPQVHIGRNVQLWGFLYDPDLTEIGDDVILGGSCIISAHMLTGVGPGEQIYVSAPVRIGEGATIGAEARIAMGVTIGPHAVLEGFSNVVALTEIGPGEVWGGNPAVFLRRRSEFETSDRPPATADKRPPPRTTPQPTDGQPLDGRANGAAPNSGPSLDGSDALDRAARLVADALHQPLESVMTEGWDSLQQLSIALTLAETCGYRASGDEIFEIRTLSDVARAMNSSRVDGNGATGHELSRENNPQIGAD